MSYAQVQVGALANYQPGEQNISGGPHGDLYTSELLPKYASLCRQGKIYKYSAAAVTLAYMQLGTPGAQSFALQNPINSGVNAMLLWTDIGFRTGSALTVGAIGWFMESALLYPPTSPTAGTVVNANPAFGAGQVVAYSALTQGASSASFPVQYDLVYATPATAVVFQQNNHRVHDGGLILPPGWLAFLANSTVAAGVGSAEVAWAELPLPASRF